MPPRGESQCALKVRAFVRFMMGLTAAFDRQICETVHAVLHVCAFCLSHNISGQPGSGDFSTPHDWARKTTD